MHDNDWLSQLRKVIELVSVWLKIRLQLFVSVFLLLVQLLLKFYHDIVYLLFDLKL